MKSSKKRWGGGFNRREPTYTRMIHFHPHVADIFRRHQWLGFFELLKGYDDEVSFDFSMALNSQSDVNPTTVIRGLVITISPEVINRVTTLPLGIKWNREDRVNSATSKKNLFRSRERHVKDKNGVRRESLALPMG